MTNPTDSISTLADIYQAAFWATEADAINPKPTETDYLRKRYVQMLFEIKRDIHILAMGIQELLDDKQSH